MARQITIRDLQHAVGDYIATYTARPAQQLVVDDFQAQDDLANLRVLHQVLQHVGMGDVPEALDKYLVRIVEKQPETTEIADLLARAGDVDGGSSLLRTLLCSYVFNLANWATVSVLSGSYLSALIVTRALFETLVVAGAGIRGTMSEKIHSLSFLNPDEIDTVNECWRELCGWAHPYGRWLSRLCPVLVARGPLHHPKIVRDCIVLLGITTDLAFAIVFAKLNVSTQSVRGLCDDMHVDWRRYMMLRKRLEHSRGDDDGAI